MNLFCYNLGENQISFACEAVALRFAYVFTDRAYGTSSTSLLVHFEEAYRGRRLRLQIKLVRKWLAEGSPERLAVFERLVRSMEPFQKLKHKGQRELVLLRKSEQVIGTYYDCYIARMVDGLGQMGLTELRELKGDEALGFINIDTQLPETQDRYFTATSRLLQLDPGWAEEDDEASVMTHLLPFEFFDPAFGPGQIGSAADAAAGTADIWLEPVLTLPDINALKADELRILRQQLRKPGQDFREAFDRWLDDALEQRCDSAARTLYFRQAVQPAAAALRETMARNHLLTGLLQAAGGLPSIEVMVGEMPLQAVWDFYEKAGALAAATGQALASAGARGALQVPVVALRPAPGLDLTAFKRHKAEEEGPPDQTARLRKTISLE